MFKISDEVKFCIFTVIIKTDATNMTDNNKI